ncbi:MAG: hypothetical protein IKM66_06975 [Clostridia bacterium]|nr:hypothetical protein [Clostridia bacterium]
MTKNTYAVKETRENNKNANKIQILMLSAMCIAILIVSFMAFFKIENNLHAFMVLAVGTALNAFVFINGRKTG